MKDFFTGIKYYGKANTVIFKHNLWPFLFIPGLMSFLFFALLIALGVIFVDDIAHGIVSSFSEWLTNHLWQWVATLVELVFNVLFWVLLLGLAYLTYKYVVLILLSPVLSHLSEVTEKKMLGIEPPDLSMKEMLHDIGRSIKINLRNLLIELPLTFLVFIMGFIPVVGFIAPVLGMFISGYFFGFGLIDYTLERKRFSTDQTIDWVKAHRPMAAGLGFATLLIEFIPVIGWFVGPTYGTVASTLLVLKTLEEEGKISRPEAVNA
ncbi:MAG: EI24 domain-containing protein [Bacteroidia bacterium]|nr:EI24 domain-containing protein [Bacteroidia bacterium]